MLKLQQGYERRFGFMNSITIGEKIAKLRKEKGLTQSQLAEMINVSNKTISRWETGEGYPEISLLVPLAKALGVSTDYLLKDASDEDAKTQSGTDTEDTAKSEGTSSEAQTGSVREETPKPKHGERKAERFSLYPPQFVRCFRSLTIFNKVSFVTVGLCILSLLISVILIMLNVLPALAQLPLVSLIAIRVGVLSAVIGFILGLLDVYDKQFRAAVYLMIANVVLGIGIPILLTLGAFSIISIYN